MALILRLPVIFVIAFLSLSANRTGAKRQVEDEKRGENWKLNGLSSRKKNEKDNASSNCPPLSSRCRRLTAQMNSKKSRRNTRRRRHSSIPQRESGFVSRKRSTVNSSYIEHHLQRQNVHFMEMFTIWRDGFKNK